MQEPMLCTTPQASVPFSIGQAGVRVYSLEELCYCVIRSAELVDRSLFSPELLRWLSDEAHRPEVAEKLSAQLSSHAALHIIAGTLLAQSGYASSEETRRVMSAIAAYENRSPGERRKLVADRLLDSGRNQAAIVAYHRMLDRPSECGLSTALWADVWNNLGTAYSRQFFFREAAACFAEAYRRDQKESSARAMAAAAVLSQDRSLLQQLSAEHGLSAEMTAEVRGLLEGLKNSASVKEDLEGIRQRADADPKAVLRMVRSLNAEYEASAR